MNNFIILIFVYLIFILNIRLLIDKILNIKLFFKQSPLTAIFLFIKLLLKINLDMIYTCNNQGFKNKLIFLTKNKKIIFCLLNVLFAKSL